LGRLRRLSGKECCKILRENGFVEVRTAGSHIVMQKQEAGSSITVPVPNHNELKMGTLASIIRQSGVARTYIES
jgi:predicted RNA binding protein YcfA (HicA-like mRNA interferase family)